MNLKTLNLIPMIKCQMEALNIHKSKQEQQEEQIQHLLNGLLSQILTLSKIMSGKSGSPAGLAVESPECCNCNRNSLSYILFPSRFTGLH